MMLTDSYIKLWKPKIARELYRLHRHAELRILFPFPEKSSRNLFQIVKKEWKDFKGGETAEKAQKLAIWTEKEAQDLAEVEEHNAIIKSRRGASNVV